jgi:hypothetical protein
MLVLLMGGVLAYSPLLKKSSRLMRSRCCLCVCVSPLSLLGNGSVKVPLSLLGNGYVVYAVLVSKESRRLVLPRTSLRFQLGSGAVIYVPSLIKIGSGIQMLIRGHTHR